MERKTLGVRKAIEAEYDALMREYDAGDYGIAELEDGEQRLTVRNRLKAAAGRRRLALTFLRTNQAGILRFRVSQATMAEPEADVVVIPTPAAEEPAAPKRRRRSGAVAAAVEAEEPATPKRRRRNSATA